ncbi:MAG: hypothetical protein U9Q91_01270, partial [Candidatus Marinimicrobia bacterium]|nr:hypothetical protein [Candidatus Neomarinimicrobiota bacterium]
MIIDKSFSTRLDEKFRVAEESLKKKFPRWDIVAYNERTNLDSLREQVHQNIEKNKRENPNIIFLSDFQRNEQNKEVIKITGSFTNRAYGLRVIKIKQNFAISHLRLIDENNNSRDMKSIEVQLSQNEQTLISPAVFVNLNGRKVGRANTNKKGYGYFHFSVPNEDHISCVASCSEDEYPEDNKRYLIIRNQQRSNILCINEKSEGNYHIKALRAMEQVKLTEITPEKLLSVNLNQYDMLWFSNTYSVTQNIIKATQIFAEEKPVIVTAGKMIDHPNGWENIVGDLKSVTDESAYYRVKNILGVEAGTDFRIKRYYHTSHHVENILWELASNDPLLMETENNIYLLLSPFHFDWNEMGLSPYFTRAISELIEYMLNIEDLSYETGETIFIKEPFSKVTTPTGEKYQVNDIFTHTNNPGFYAIENSSGRKTVAVNIPESEYVQAQLKTENIKILEWNGKDTADIERQIKGRNSQTLFYILALLFIIFEMMLLRKGERTK